MGPFVLYTHAKNGEDPYSCFSVKFKEVKKNFFGQLIPYNKGLRIFHEYNLAQTTILLSSTLLQKIRKILRAVLK